jgi:hypothetical protein
MILRRSPAFYLTRFGRSRVGRLAPYLVAIVLGVCFSGILDWIERQLTQPPTPRRIRGASDG